MHCLPRSPIDISLLSLFGFSHSFLIKLYCLFVSLSLSLSLSVCVCVCVCVYQF